MDDAIEPTHQLNPDETLESLGRLRAAKREEDESKAKVQVVLHTMKAGGHKISALREARKIARMEQQAREDYLRAVFYYLRVEGVEVGVGQMTLSLDNGPNLVDAVIQKRAEQHAKEAGFQARFKNAEPRDNNPHDPGTAQWSAWDGGWQEGDAAKSRVDEARGVTEADDSRARRKPDPEDDDSIRG